MAASSPRLAAWGRLMLRWRWLVVGAWCLAFCGATVAAKGLPSLLQSGSGALWGTRSAAAEAALRRHFRNPFTLGLALTLRHPTARVD
ncbi:MAG: hypothetical protein VKQ33_09400, partial [Candidatus Sericytochromatia bacterium]|nr:hypothetical protein [Candidatus Sericytochromatia bacterium]